MIDVESSLTEGVSQWKDYEDAVGKIQPLVKQAQRALKGDEETKKVTYFSKNFTFKLCC